ncbi:MAG: hypothetical protein ACR2IE_06525 [Candidatus Sumerlaeaceae bacterium]
MDEEDIIAPSGPAPLTLQDYLAQYGMVAVYLAAIYMLCFVLCRFIRWNSLGRSAGLIQGAVLIACVTAMFMLWGLRYARLEDEYDLIKAFGIGFLTLLVSIGASAHGEYGRSRQVQNAELVGEPDQTQTPGIDAELLD